MADSAGVLASPLQEPPNGNSSSSSSSRLATSALLQSPPPPPLADIRCLPTSNTSEDIKTRSLASPSALPPFLSSSQSPQCQQRSVSARNKLPPVGSATALGDSNSIRCMNCKTTTTPLWRRDPATGSHLCNRCGLYLKTYNAMHPLTRIKRRAIGGVARTQRNNQGAMQTKPRGCSSAPDASSHCSGHFAGASSMDDVEQIPRPANCSPPELHYLPKTQNALQRQQQQQRRITPKQQISLGMTPKCFNCNAEQTPLWRRDPQDNIICNACGLYYKLHGKPRPV
ncbi:GATA type transcriptional activator of nitrogen-regulated proteins, partial [Coemansia sp. RSA 1285]